MTGLLVRPITSIHILSKKIREAFASLIVYLEDGLPVNREVGLGTIREDSKEYNPFIIFGADY